MSGSHGRSTLGGVSVPFRGTGAGVVAAFVAGAVVDVLDVVLEATLNVRGLSWEMGLIVVPIAAAAGGLPAGFLGALVGRRWVGGVVGALGLGAAALGVFALGAVAMPFGTRAGSVAAGLAGGFAAGFAGGSVTERFQRRQASRSGAPWPPA